MTLTMDQLLKSSPRDWAAVQRRIEENPDEIRCVGSLNRTVLHFACWKKAPLDMVVFLLERYPDAARAKDYNGCHPLHAACYDGQSVAVIELLVEVYPDALSVTDNGGNTPLQWAKEKKHVDITAYLESMTPDSVKTRKFEERIAVMVDKKLNEQTNELSTLTSIFKTDHESKLSALTTDLDACNKKIADIRKDDNAIIENELSDLTAELRTVNQNNYSALKEDLKSCNENIADLEKVVEENITANVVERIDAMVNKKINEQTNEISNITMDLKNGNEMTLFILTEELKTCNKKIADLEREVKAGNESTLSNLTAERITGNANTFSSLSGKVRKSEENIAAIVDKKLNTLKEELKADNKTIEADLKFAIWQGIFFCIFVLITFLNISSLLAAKPNITSVTIVDDTTFLVKHPVRMMGVLKTFMIHFRVPLVFFCFGILGLKLLAHSKIHFWKSLVLFCVGIFGFL